MTAEELAREITKGFDKVPDELAANLCEYLCGSRVKGSEFLERARNIARILHEDRELLHKLAE